MEIRLADIVRKKQSFSLLEAIDIVDSGFELKSPIEAVFKFSQQAENVFAMTGSMKALVETACDRCGKLVSIALDQHFDYVLRVEEEPAYSDDYQCNDEECDTLFLADASLDSHEILREQILLALPLRQLCDYSCKGLCGKCGIDLNDKKCQCGESNENSPFAILKTLQKK